MSHFSIFTTMGLHSFFFGKNYTDLELADMIREGGNASSTAITYLELSYWITIKHKEAGTEKVRAVKGFRRRSKEIIEREKADEDIIDETWIDFITMIRRGISPNSMWAYFNTILNRKIFQSWRKQAFTTEDIDDKINQLREEEDFLEDEGWDLETAYQKQDETFNNKVKFAHICAEEIAYSAKANEHCRKKCKLILDYEAKAANGEVALSQEAFAPTLEMTYDNYRQCKQRCMKYIADCIIEKQKKGK